MQTGAAVERIGHTVRRADGQNRVRAGDRLVVDQDAAARLPDGHVGSDPHAAHRDRLGATGPQRVDHQLQVPIEDDLTAALDAFLRHVAEILRGAGIGERHRQPGTGDRGGRRREVGAVEAAEQSPATRVALEAAASFGVELSCQRVAPGRRGVRRLLRRYRTLPESTCWLSRTPGAVAWACATANAKTVAIARAASTCQLAVANRLLGGAPALRCAAAAA